MSQQFTQSYLSSLALSQEQIDSILDNLEADPDYINDEEFPPILVIIESQVLDLKGFIIKHPGGPHAILQYTGKDATNAFNSMHSGRARQHAKQFIVGTIKE
jgi:cytochrome b involved in lipid metabolism